MEDKQPEPLRDRLKRERETRIQAKRELREANAEARKALDEFASQWNSVPRPTKQDETHPDFDVKRAVTQTQPSLPPPPPAAPAPPAKPGVPIEFYCWKDGKMAVIHIYAMGEASFL